MNSIRSDAPIESDIALTLTRSTLHDILQQRASPVDAMAAGELRLSGDATRLGAFFGLLDRFTGNFPVVDAAPMPA